MRISGIVLLEPGHPEFRGASLHVRLLDVSRLDAPSVTLAETVIRGVTHRAGEERAVPFVLETSEVASLNPDLSVAAHLEQAPTPTVTVRRGDLVTTTSNPVPRTGIDGVVVRLTPVRADAL